MPHELHETKQTTWLFLVIICMAQFLSSADNVTLSIATGALMHDLNASLPQISKANTMYPLVGGTFMVAGGMIGVMIGWKKTFRVGLLIYLLGEIGAVLSPSMTFFVYVARVLAGMGGSFMIPSVFGLITGIYRGRQRAVAFGALGAASGVSFALGPIICGTLLELVGWRWAFGFMGGLILIILACSLLLPAIEHKKHEIRFDMPGFLLSTAGLFLLVFGMLQIPAWGVVSPFDPPFTIFGCSPAPAVIAAGVAVLLFMLRLERIREARVGSALVPQAFLRTRQVRIGLYLTIYIFFAYSSGIFVTVSFMQVVAGWSAIQTGLLIVPFAVSLSSCSLGIPVLIKHRNQSLECRIGLVLGIVGAAVAAAGIGELSFHIPLVTFGLCLIGMSMGVIAANAPFLVTSALETERDAQQSGGVQAAARDIGQALGVALVSMVMLTALTFNMKQALTDHPGISSRTRASIDRLAVIPYLGDKAFQAFVVKNGGETGDIGEMLPVYQKSRASVTRYGLLSMSVTTLFFLAGIWRFPPRQPQGNVPPSPSVAETRKRALRQQDIDVSAIGGEIDGCRLPARENRY